MMMGRNNCSLLDDKKGKSKLLSFKSSWKMEDSKDFHFIQIIQDYYIDFYSKIMEFV